MENDISRPQMSIDANIDPAKVKKPNNIPAILLGFMLVAAVYQIFGAQFFPKRQAVSPIAESNHEVACGTMNAPQTSRQLTKNGLRPTIDETEAPGC